MILVPVLLAGCASSDEQATQEFDERTANTRALEQRRMNAVTSGDAASERGAEVLVGDKYKEFNLAAMRGGSAKAFGTKGAYSNEFHFVDRVRTKDFYTRDYVSKKAWMGDAKFATKASPTKESWFSRRTARSEKTYATKESRDANREHGTRALPGGEKPFLVQGRTQAGLDATGKDKIPFGTTDMGPSWSGELKPLTVDDVKGLLNKN
jgi:hypothetical protein